MRGCFTLIVIVCALVYFTPGDWLVTDGDTGMATVDRPVPKGTSQKVASSGGTLSRSYVWSDINRRKYRFSGDKIIYRTGTGDAPLKMTVKLPQERVDRAVDAFGVPEDRMTFSISYRTQAELERKRRERDVYLNSRGFTRIDEARVGPNYDWILDRSRQDLAPTMRKLQALAISRDYKTMRDLYGMVASFVQSLKYVIPPDKRKVSSGVRVVTSGLNMPQEALMIGQGDCDTVSMLFAGLTANLKTAKVVLVVGERGFDHAFVGVRSVPRPGDRYITVKGVRFTLIELTNILPIGFFPSKNWKSVQRNMYRVIPLG